MKFPRRRTLEQAGHTVGIPAIPAGVQTDLESRTGVEVQDIRRSVLSGQDFPVTLTFRRAAPATVQITVGPLPERR